MLNNGMPVLWIIINSSDLQNSLVLIFAGMQYKLNDINTFVGRFTRMIATINPVAMARFFDNVSWYI